MTTTDFFKWALGGMALFTIASTVAFIKLIFSERAEEEAMVGILAMSVCFIAVLVAMLILAKAEAETILKEKEIARKEKMWEWERMKDLSTTCQYRYDAKELMDLLKDFKEENLVEFQNFIEWTKKQ